VPYSLENALKKSCPYRVAPSGLCVTTACMGWRWYVPPESAAYAAKEPASDSMGFPPQTVALGYCGPAGQRDLRDHQEQEKF